MSETGPFVLAVDLGTSAAKAGLFDPAGRLVSEATVEYPAAHPRPAWAEQSAHTWWQAAVRVIRGALAGAAAPADAVKAVSVSGQAPTCLPVDRHGEPLRPALLWIDRRATAEADWAARVIGAEAAQRISGNALDAFFGGIKWRWFREHEPELFARTWKLMQANGYLTFKLTGEVVTDYSQAALCSPAFDLRAKAWCEPLCAELGVPPALLPALAPSTAVIGRVHAAGASATGLAAGTPVVAGGGDFACATLGCGVFERGQVVQMLGTAGNLLIPMGDTVAPDYRLVNTLQLSGDYLMAGSIFAGGVLQWFRDQLGGPEVAEAQAAGRSVYAVLDEHAARVPAGSDGLLLLPYFMGERAPLWDPYARGLYLGLTPYHTRAHLYRAALEGVAYAFRHMAEIIGEQGVAIKDVIAGDGGARSAVWRGIFADVLNARVHHYQGGLATLQGNAALAGVAAGLFPDLTVVRGWQAQMETAEPDPARHALYGRYYAVYRQAYLQLKDQFRALAELAQLGA